MPMTAPLFLESKAYTSTLYLVNQLNFGVQADVSAYDMSGALLTTGHFYLDANTSQTISIHKLLADASFYAEAGSIEVVSPENWTALLGQLSITRTGDNTTYLDEELFMPEKNGSKNLRAVIDSPQNSPIVSVANVSTTEAQTLQISCTPSAGDAVSKTITLRPKQTQLVRACSTLGDMALSPDAVDAQFITKPESPLGMAGQQVAGISIATNGPAGELAAFGFVEHADSYGHYFSAMNFADVGLLKSTGTVFAGVPVGASAANTGAVYTPEVALTNFSNTPQTASVSLASTVAGASTTNVLTQVTLAPNSSQLVTLPQATGSPQWQNSFIVHSSGQPGDVLSKMMFKTAGPLPNIELIGKDELDIHNAGDHPWSLENGVGSTLFLFNHADADKQVSVRIGVGSSVWLKIYTLQPNETKAVSIGDLIQRKTPDDKGFIFPRNVTQGEIAWWVPGLTAPKVHGRVVQTDASGTMARNFSCGSGVALTGIQWSNYSGYYQVEDDHVISITPQPEFEVIDYPAEGDCPSGGQSTTQSTYLSWQWYIGYPALASFQNDMSSNQTVYIDGDSDGSTPIQVDADAGGNNGCSAEGTLQVMPPSVTISNPVTTTLTAGAVDNSGNAKQYTFTAVGNPSTDNNGNTGTYAWTSSGGGVTLTNTTSATVSVVGTASATPTLSVTYTVGGLASQPATLALTVLKPNNILVTDDIVGYSSRFCSIDGALRTLIYAIRFNSTTIPDGINVRENVPATVDSCGQQVKTGNAGFNTYTVSPMNGYDFDDFLVTCSTAQTSCHYQFSNQQWQQINADGSYSSIGTVGPVQVDSVSGATVAGHNPTQNLEGSVFQ